MRKKLTDSIYVRYLRGTTLSWMMSRTHSTNHITSGGSLSSYNVSTTTICSAWNIGQKRLFAAASELLVTMTTHRLSTKQRNKKARRT